MGSENDRKEMEEKVKDDVKRLLAKFAEEIKNFDDSKVPFFIEREENLRVPSEEPDDSRDFRQRMLKNAPQQDGDYIIAEKKGWK
jgi:Asp-tRNA(Asn)/Glu-tRNA(Gln) amidotransferase C subunit